MKLIKSYNLGLLFFALPFFLFAQQVKESIIYPEVENKTEKSSLYNLNLGSLGIDFEWEGYWKFKTSYGTSWTKSPKGFVFPSSYPGISQGFQFSQEPDFSLNLLIMDHFFLESQFSQGFKQNTFAMGYKGGKSSPIDEIRIGNTGISIGSYKGIESSSPQYNTPGISAKFKTDRSVHELMFRYDTTSLFTKTFIGPYEVEEEKKGLSTYIQGYTFILPNKNIKNFTLYIEDNNGTIIGSDGYRYRKTNIPYSIDLEKGILKIGSFDLNNPIDLSDQKILIYYQSEQGELGSNSAKTLFIEAPNSQGYPDPSLPLLPFSWEDKNPYVFSSKYPNMNLSFEESASITIEGNKGLIINDPQQYSCFQNYNLYQFNTNLPKEQWRTIISMIPQKQRDNYIFTIDQDQKLLEVIPKGESSRSPLSRTPFALFKPSLYGPLKVSPPQELESLIISIKQDNENYFLGTNIVTDSVRVYINGIEDNSVSIDEKIGTLTFARYIFPEDRIEVFYRVESESLEGGDFIGAVGNKFFPSPYSEIEFAQSIRWAIPSSSISLKPDENRGIARGAGAWTYKKGETQFEIAGQVDLIDSDTAGFLKLLGMEEDGFSFYLSQKSLSQGPSLFSSNYGFKPEKRGTLFYKDFFLQNKLGQSYLNNYSWKNYTQNNSSRPYIVAPLPEDHLSGNIVGMSYKLLKDQWVSGDLFFNNGNIINLSSYSKLSFKIKLLNNNSSKTRLFIFLGENGELEDMNENGFNDPENPLNIVQKEIGPLNKENLGTSLNQWVKISIPLSKSERERLTRTKSLKLLLLGEGDQEEGDLLIADLKVDGSPFETQILSQDEGTISSGYKNSIQGDTLEDTTLLNNFNETKTLFHPKGEEQKSFHLSWGEKAIGGKALPAKLYAKAQSNFTPFSPLNYKKASIYLKSHQLGGNYRIKLSDESGRGLSLDYSALSTDWEKLTIDFQKGSGEFSGKNKISSMTIDPHIGLFRSFTIEVYNLESGEVEVDELFMESPTLTKRSQLSTHFSHNHPETLLPGWLPQTLLGNTSIATDLTLSHISQETLFAKGVSPLSGQIQLGLDLLMTRLEGSCEFRKFEEETPLSGGHYIRFPSKFSYFWVSDSYSRTFNKSAPSMTKENIIHLAPFQGLTIQGKIKNAASLSKMTQIWEIKEDSYLGPLILLSKASLINEVPWSMTEGNYLETWYRDFSYLLPAKEQSLRREGFGTGYISLDFPIFSFNINPQINYKAEQSYRWYQENTYKNRLSIPINIQLKQESWTLTPYYERELKQIIYPNEYDNFSSDLQTFARGIETQLPLTHFIPFYELFDQNSFETFKKSLTLSSDSEYTPSAHLLFSKPLGSEFKDLFLPNSLDFWIKRTYKAEGDSIFWENDWNFSYTQRAINLFGQWGSTPLFSFFDSDEYTSSLNFSLNGRSQWAPTPKQIVYQNYLKFIGFEKWSFSLDNRFSHQFEDKTLDNSLQFIFQWMLPPTKSLKLPFIKEFKPNEYKIEHSEKIILDYKNYPDQPSLFATFLKHETMFHLNNIGTLKGWYNMGLSFEDKTFTNGVELGIELVLTF